MTGATVRQEGHHEAVQKVIKALRFEAESNVSESNSSACFMLSISDMSPLFGIDTSLLTDRKCD